MDLAGIAHEQASRLEAVQSTGLSDEGGRGNAVSRATNKATNEQRAA